MNFTPKGSAIMLSNEFQPSVGKAQSTLQISNPGLGVYPGLPRWLNSKAPSAVKCRRHGFEPWVGKIPWRRAWQPTQIFLPWKSHGQKSQEGYSLWGCEELDTTEATEHTQWWNSGQRRTVQL
jgi:hypothetical protein